MNEYVAPPGWLRSQILRYEAVRPRYREFEELLGKVLQYAAANHVSGAFIQTRTKDPSSFADKAYRKLIRHCGTRYLDPLAEMTDLCAARFVTHSVEEVERMCQLIEATFPIDKENSEDTRKRLKPDQFGYQSVHYIVQLPPKVSPLMSAAGITQAQLKKIGCELKAELQVRTLAQHVWADVAHDRIYKNTFDPPVEWTRQLAGIGASLEQVDEALSSLISKSDAYRRHHDRFRTEEQWKEELETVTALLEAEKEPSKKSALALKMAWLYAGAGESSSVLTTLEPYVEGGDATASEITLEYGVALCRQNQGSHSDPEYRRGIQMLLRLVADDNESDFAGMPVDLRKQRARTHAYYALGQEFLEWPQMKTEALDNFRKAYYRDPKDPYYLAAYLGCEIYSTTDTGLLRLVVPQIEAAIATCENHAEFGIDLPYALFTLGQLWLLLNNVDKALDSYLQAVQFCVCGHYRLPSNIFDREIQFLKQLEIPDLQSEELVLLRRILNIAAKVQEIQSSIENETEAGHRSTIIIAGNGKGSIEEQESPLTYLLSTFSGTVICGGSTTGISGLVGEITARLESRQYTLLGYLPRQASIGVRQHHAYDRIVHTSGHDFGYAEPTTYWEELLSAGVDPRKVKLLGFGGGPVAMFEYKLALALGAVVGLGGFNDAAIKRFEEDKTWNRRRLFSLPAVPGTGALDSKILWALVTVDSAHDPQGSSTLIADPKALDAVAELIHEAYREEALGTVNDENLRPWSSLSEDLKEANRSQVRVTERLLNTVGLGLRPGNGSPDPRAIEELKARLEELAAQEHGRWVIDRFENGYRYGRSKDYDKKTHPLLIAWDDPNLSQETKDYDRKTVLSWPESFASVGWEIYCLAR